MITSIIFYLLSAILITVTVLPMIRKDHWAFRIFEFPRLQKFVLSITTLILGFFVFPRSFIVIAVLIIIIANSVYLFYLIFPFTKFGRKHMRSAFRRYKGPGIHIYISNVYQPNVKFSRLLRQIRKEDPDIVFLVETDGKWKDALRELEAEYPYHILHPADNMYGMLLYSRFELTEKSVRFLIKDDIPSIRCTIKIPDAGEIQFFGVHPEPPSPTENEYSTERDAELLYVARECEKETRPIIVAGDLNDVAWSYTTERFIQISELVDPRRGRGIFATFHAGYFFMRWPLDHIFCSRHFSLIKMKRKRSIGSDHFPVSIRMALSDVGSPSLRQR